MGLKIVYLQTMTSCNGHCAYCPHDDVYGGKDPYFTPKMLTMDDLEIIVAWIKEYKFFDEKRIGFLLHYEPTTDKRLPDWFRYLRNELPEFSLEVATNGLITDNECLELADCVDEVGAGSREVATTRAGNCHHVEGVKWDAFFPWPCSLPVDTLCIAADRSVLLCCMDWRHEVVVGTIDNLHQARATQLELAKFAEYGELEICEACRNSLTAEDVGDRLGKRTPDCLK